MASEIFRCSLMFISFSSVGYCVSREFHAQILAVPAQNASAPDVNKYFLVLFIVTFWQNSAVKMCYILIFLLLFKSKVCKNVLHIDLSSSFNKQSL